METAVTTSPSTRFGAATTPATGAACDSPARLRADVAPARTVLRKTPPQGLRLRRFKRTSARATSPLVSVDLRLPLTLRKPARR